MNYKVKESDLKGDIKGFPIEVVQAMVNEQVRQGNKADVKVFQDGVGNDKESGGFDWYKSNEANGFWSNVIFFEKFDMFFNKYPKQSDLTDSKTKQTQSTMKEYNKEKLHEYAKELFALCLDKGLIVRSDGEESVISVYKRVCNGFRHIGDSYLSEHLYKSEHAMPIWELVEKVKQL